MTNSMLPLIINGIIASLAIIGTIINTILTNRHQAKLRSIDFKNKITSDDYRHVQKLFEDFLRYSFSVAASNVSKENVDQLVQSYSVLIPYIPAESQGIFDQFMTILRKTGTADYSGEKPAEFLKRAIVPVMNDALSQYKEQKNR